MCPQNLLPDSDPNQTTPSSLAKAVLLMDVRFSPVFLHLSWSFCSIASVKGIVTRVMCIISLHTFIVLLTAPKRL